MKITDIFERIGLLETDDKQDAWSTSDYLDAEADQALEQQILDEIPAVVDSPTEVNQDAVNALAAEIDESRSLADIYKEASIPDSPFPADKLLKLLEGLKTLPEDVRKQAIRAMDAAEEDWTIEDPLLDAQRRIQALETEHQQLEQQANSAESKAETDLKGQDQYQQQASQQIHQQIMELEQLLEQELQTVAEARESIKAKARTARQTCQRQQASLAKEMNRLTQISTLFAAAEHDSAPQPNHRSGDDHG